MGMRWQLYDPDFYTDVFGFEDEEDESDEEVYICKCSGRGKTNEERRIPRIPYIKSPFLEELQNIPSQHEPSVRKKGKGRGRILREKMERLPAATGLENFGCRENFERQRSEPMFLDNSSFVGTAAFAVRKISPFANLSQQSSRPPPSPHSFEEDFPSLSSSPHSSHNQRPVFVVPKASGLSDNDSESASLKDLNNLAQIFKDSASVGNSSSSSYPTSPEKSSIVTSTSGRTTTSSEDVVLYTSDSESTYSEMSENMAQGSVVSSTSSGNQWTVTQGNIIQLDGLPQEFDMSTLEELIAQYGTIQEMQIMECGTSVSVRFRFSSEDACVWVVSCLDGTDGLFPESNRILQCYKVE
ncbi:uncharacterized protein [Argopecten irradians]|uniref:uncharacterized protein n=1 Tax=Argopecten irradians TaxID=31199 RepID=UPI00371BFF95